MVRVTETFKDKVVVVTGGSRGIGKSIAAGFAARGASTVIVSRKQDACERAASEIGANCTGIAANVGDIEAASSVVDGVVARFGRIDILVNNAATNPYSGLTIDVDPARWTKTLQVNLTAPLIWSQLAWTKSMRAASGGSAIVNISSVGGLWTSRDHGVYDVSKAALNHLTRQLAAELGPRVRVNAVCPGLVKTDFNRRLFADDPHGVALGRSYPMQRIGEGADVAHATLFLASEEASWITGQILVVDGGGQIGFERTG